MKTNNFIAIIVFTVLSSIVYSQTVVPKQVGIGFRWDDNDNITKYSEYFAIFNKYGFKAGLGLNFGNEPMGPAPNAYVDSLRKFQQQGHELMDHTPNHRTNFFRTTFNVFDYDGLPGVDHRVGNKICVEFATPILSNAIASGYCDISGNVVTSAPGAFHPGSTDANTGYYLYFPSLPSGTPNLVLMDLVVVDTTSVRVTDVWNDPVNLGILTNVQYYLYSAAGVRLSIDGLRVLANETLKLANSYSLQRPTTWIQPGMAFVANNGSTQNLIFPTLNRADLKTALTPLGYTAGATYSHSFQEEAVLTFNEYDPNQDAQFGMQWNRMRDEANDLDELKFQIAHYVAINKVALGGGHGNPEEGWIPYLEKIESLLAWCQLKNIPVKTYKQWADLLYNNVYNNTVLPDPYQNIFPKISQDFDGNNYPDGYDLNGQYSTAFSTWITNDGPPGSNGYSFSSQNGSIEVMVDNTKLGSVEKSENYFEIWIKGDSNSADLIVAPLFFDIDGGWDPINPETGPEFRFQTNTSYWKRYRLENSSIDKSINIADNVSSIVFTIRSAAFFTANDIRVGGIKLFKKGPSLNLTAALEGAYNLTTNNMSRYLSQLNYIPTYQPYSSSPWNFAGDTLVTNTQVITGISGAAGYAVDWVLVELRDTPTNIVSRKAGLIRQNGSIIDPTGSPLTFEVPSGQYYITVRHRNHLMIRSTNTVSLTAGITTNYNLTAAGNSVGAKLLDSSPVVWGMIAGDVNGNGQIQNNDNEDFIDLQIGQTGYRNADIDMDGDVDADDISAWHQNNGLGVQ